MFAPLRRCRRRVDLDVVVAADAAARLRNVTYLLRAQLTASSLSSLDHLPQVLLPLTEMSDYEPISDDELNCFARLSIYLSGRFECEIKEAPSKVSCTILCLQMK